jgi:aryl-alcohol dehydrogenase-like predicted oxidoreductase
MELNNIILGSSNYGSKVSSKNASQLIKICYHWGIRSIDTSPLYGFGLSEKLIGKVVEDLGRENIILNTKVGLNPSIKVVFIRKFILPFFRNILFSVSKSRKNIIPNLTQRNIMSKEEIVVSFNKSLNNLRTAYIDTLFIHTDYITYFNCPEILILFEDLKLKNQIKWLGITSELTSANEIQFINNNKQIDHIQVPFKKRHLVKGLKRDIKISYYSPFMGEVNIERSLENIKSWYASKNSNEFLVVNFSDLKSIKNHLIKFQSI